MKRLLFPLSVLLTLLLLPSPAVAQQQPSSDQLLRPLNVEGHLSFQMGVPQGRFADQVRSTGFGGSFGLLADIGRSPFKVGAELGVLVYGLERRYEPLSTTIPDLTVRVETTNNIALGHLILRFAPEAGSVKPFIDGLFGTKYLFTQTSLHSEQVFDEGPILASTNFDDFALSYGVGGGVGIVLYRGVMGPRMGTVQLDVGARYLFGGDAQYLKKGSIRRENGQVEYEVLRSRTDMIIPQLGLTVKI